MRCHARQTLAFILLLAAGVAPACGDDDTASDPLEGLYAITSHVRSTADCDTTEDVVRASCVGCIVDTDLFELDVVSRAGQTFMTVRACTSDTICDDTDPIAAGQNLLDRKQGDTWIGEFPVTAFTNGSCSFTSNALSVRPTSSGVLVTREVGTASRPDITSADDCFAAFEPAPAAASLSCQRIEVIEATAR